METSKTLDLVFYILGLICFGILAVIAIITYIYGTGWLYKMPACAFNKYTGYYCPGCGGTRAVFALLRGHPVRSFIYHPFVPYSIFTGAWFVISQTIQRLSRDRIKIGMRFREIYLWIALIIALVNVVVKNALLIFANIALLG